MVFEIILFLMAGIGLGVFLGLVPGIHPNMLILMVPLLLGLNIDPLAALVMLVAAAVTNVIIDFIPSLIFGAPDSELGVSVLPSHKLLLAGQGYESIKLLVVGSFGAIIFSLVILPIAMFAIPLLYAAARPYIHLILTAVVGIMVFTGKRKFVTWLIFVLAGIIGLLFSKLPLDSNLSLFPILTGFFGLPVLLTSIKSVRFPKQKFSPKFSFSTQSIILGTLGGLFSGILPGIGSSELAGLSTVKKNGRNFLTTLSALVMSNIIFSFLAIWLISNPRSGIAVAASQFVDVGLNEVSLILLTSLIAGSLASILTLKFSKYSLRKVSGTKYGVVNKFIVVFLISATILTTGILGLSLLVVCTALGILTNLLNVKRGLLMAVLIVPTISFFAGFVL